MPERCSFDPDALIRVETVEQIWSLAPDSDGVFVSDLDDAKLAAIAAATPDLRHLIAGGSSRLTDAGLGALATFTRLENLDLEWSLITDQGLGLVGAISSLRWLDIGFSRCT